ncbi:hypothetical protein QBK99_15100 [Corticibacterium sp. UT-5YL-CI-8]|nr:hypothetical protein [Tianweitania sp. UT-5YL-CI-8]
MVKRPYILSDLDLPINESRLSELLDDIEQEETPERLLTLARELQRRLLMKKQRDNPN